MTDLRSLCQEILRLDAEATEGPWVDCTWDPMERPHVYAKHLLERHNHGAVDAPYTKNDAVLIARYRTLAPQLARAVLEQLKGGEL